MQPAAQMLDTDLDLDIDIELTPADVLALVEEGKK